MPVQRGWGIPSPGDSPAAPKHCTVPCGATVQLPSKLPPAEGTARPFHADVPGENPVSRDSEASVQVTFRTHLHRVNLRSKLSKRNAAGRAAGCFRMLNLSSCL